MTNADLREVYDRAYREGGFFTVDPALESAHVAASRDWVGETVLDIGCGTGYTGELIGKTAKRFVGLDYSGEAIKQAQERKRENTEYIVTDFRDYEPDEKFDTAILQGTVEHMDDPLGAVLKRLRDRILKRDGVVVITVPNFDNPRGLILVTMAILFDAPISLTDKHIYTEREVYAAADCAGFAVRHRETFHNSWGNGEDMFSDFWKRIPNVLKDMGVANGKMRATQLEFMIRGFHTFGEGATALYILV